MDFNNINVQGQGQINGDIIQGRGNVIHKIVNREKNHKVKKAGPSL